MRKKLYLETSVWNQLEHNDRPDWYEVAHRFMETLKAGYYDAYISTVVIDEIAATPDFDLQRRLSNHIEKIAPTLLEINEETSALAGKYLDEEFPGRISQRLYRDCAHVAVATVNDIKHIISFNCAHLVNDRRIDGFNAINFKSGYELIVDISMPHKFLTYSNWG